MKDWRNYTYWFCFLTTPILMTYVVAGACALTVCALEWILEHLTNYLIALEIHAEASSSAGAAGADSPNGENIGGKTQDASQNTGDKAAEGGGQKANVPAEVKQRKKVEDVMDLVRRSFKFGEKFRTAERKEMVYEANANYVGLGLICKTKAAQAPEYAELRNFWQKTVTVRGPDGRMHLHEAYVGPYYRLQVPWDLLHAVLRETGVKEENLSRFQTFEDVRNWLLFVEHRKNPDFLNFKK